MREATVVLLQVLRARFGVTAHTLPVVFAPKRAEFGPLVVELDGDRGFTVCLGRFTHSHVELDARAPRFDEAAEAVAALCAAVMADEIVCFRVPNGGGSVSRDCAHELALYESVDAWTWSGPFPLAEKT